MENLPVAIKRPRNESISDSKEIVKPVKKKSKKKKNKKPKGGSGGDDGTSSSSRNRDKSKDKSLSSNTGPAEPSTATVDGQTMSQVLSTFNRIEQSRFEAFRKSTFKGDAISRYIAHCLAVNYEKSYASGEKTRQLMGGTSLGVGLGCGSTSISSNNGSSVKRSKLNRHIHQSVERALRKYPHVSHSDNKDNNSSSEAVNNNTNTVSRRNNTNLRLEDMVAPGEAEEITIVVSTLAKAYAQRLITAARRVALSEESSCHNNRGSCSNTGSANNNNSPDGEQVAISPNHVLEAHRIRLKAGLDPGFFLQKNNNVNSATGCNSISNNNITPFSSSCNGISSRGASAALGIVDKHQLLLEATLHAQDEYKKHITKQEERNHGDYEDNESNKSNNDKEGDSINSTNNEDGDEIMVDADAAESTEAVSDNRNNEKDTGGVNKEKETDAKIGLQDTTAEGKKERSSTNDGKNKDQTAIPVNNDVTTAVTDIGGDVSNFEDDNNKGGGNKSNKAPTTDETTTSKSSLKGEKEEELGTSTGVDNPPSDSKTTTSAPKNNPPQSLEDALMMDADSDEDSD